MARLVIGFAYLMVFLSGTTGLIYQVVWQKYLSIYLGSHASATALVLSAFFLYLAVGYFVLGKYSHRLIKNKLVLYGVLELAIGAYALVSPDYFNWLQTYFLSQPWAAGFGTHFIFSSLFLAVPTFLMGGTIPVLTEGLSTQFDRSHRVHAYVYGLNTAGAFFGTLLAGFYLIEKFGLPLTLTLAGIANITIFLMCYVLGKATAFSFSGLPTDAVPTVMPARERWSLYAISFCSGFYVFSLENLIIRMAGAATFSSAYSYSIIVASFIVAIASGSFWAARFDSLGRAKYMAAMQAGLLVACTALYFSIPGWPDYFGRVRALILPGIANLPWLWALITLSFIFILIIPVGLMGMNLPLLFGYLRRRNEHLSAVVGRLYGANSLGSVLGAAVGGYYFYLFFDGPQVFRANLFLMTLNLVLILSLQPFARRQKVLAGGIAAICLTVTSLSAWDPLRFVPSRFLPVLLSPADKNFSAALKRAFPGKGQVLFSKYDPNTFVTVIRNELPAKDPLTGMDHVLTLNVNSKPDAQHPGDSLARVSLPLVATALAPKIESAFIVGFGGGLSTAVVTNLSDNKFVEVAEISQGVIEGAEFFDKANGNLSERRQKYNVVLGDAYQVLLSKKDKYDLILSEPSNPWVSGVEKLFSFEFLKNIADHLNDDGVFGQWFPMAAVSETDFVEILNTLNSIFPYISVWNAGGGTISIVSSFKPLSIDADTLIRRYQENQNFYKTILARDPFSILGRQMFSIWTVRGLASRTKSIQTLENPTLNYTTARSFLAGVPGAADQMLAKLLIKPVPKENKDTHFFYEAHTPNLTAQFFTDTLEFLKTYGGTGALVIPRMEYLREKLSPSPARPETPRRHEWIGYVLGERPLPPKSNSMDPMERTRNAFQAYVTAKLAQLTPSPARVMALADTECKSEKCVDLQTQILNEFLPKDQRPKALSRPVDSPAARAEVAEAFNRLKQSLAGTVQ